MVARPAPAFRRPGWIFELKYDGYRVLCSRIAGLAQIRTRGGQDATAWFPELASAIARLPGTFIADGEACVVDERGVPDFERLHRRARRRGRTLGDDRATLYLFDLVMVNGRDIRSWPLLRRKQRLRQLVPAKHDTIGYVDFVEDEGLALYHHAVSIGMEGVVGKRADSRYRGGESRDWLKSKPKGIHDGWLRRAPGGAG